MRKEGQTYLQCACIRHNCFPAREAATSRVLRFSPRAVFQPARTTATATSIGSRNTEASRAGPPRRQQLSEKYLQYAQKPRLFVLPYIGPRRENSGQGASRGGGVRPRPKAVQLVVVRISFQNGCQARCVVFSLRSMALIAISFKRRRVGYWLCSATTPESVSLTVSESFPPSYNSTST